MTPVRYIIDTSALVRILRNPDVRGRWQSQITSGLVAVSPITELEFLYSAQSKSDREQLLDLLSATFAWVGLPDRAMSRAAEVQVAMTAQGTHRSAGVVDLLVAATAELNGLSVLHYDHDFDVIAEATDQPTVWVAPAGSIA